MHWFRHRIARAGATAPGFASCAAAMAAAAATAAGAIAAASLAAAPLFAQEVEVTEGQAAVVAAGHGKVMLSPDRATVMITIKTIAAEPDEAASRNEATTEEVTAAIEALDLEPDSLRLTGLRVGPNREYTPEGPRDAGFFAQRGLRVTTNDISDVARIVSAAVEAGATQIDHVAYSSSREEEARQEVLTKAVEEARTDAETVAAAAGGRLGAVILLSTQNVDVPRPMVRFRTNALEMASADAALPEPEDITVTAFVQAHWAFIQGN